ncbi:MAG: metal ABC transporter permease [Anaerolineales bacterium]|nr:metal ABC transporter permease [Anaerolineales bacterium]MDW8163050.1 metal ABC transporter permease [Anaerolineales bacterium]
MLEWLLTPFRYPFMWRGLLAVLLMSNVCAVVGTFVVLRGMAFFGDALAHAILPGVAIGYLVSGGRTSGLFWWALGAAVLSALGISFISRKVNLKEDTAIGIVFAGMFALGVTLISTVRSYSVDLTHFLFGDVLGVRSRDLWFSAVFGALVLFAVAGFYKEFITISFDPVLATTLRLPVNFLNYFLMLLMAIAIVVSLQTVGVALMVAMLITPAATAYLLVPRLPQMIWVAASIASLSGIVGLYLSYYLSIASGGAIVLTATALFLMALALQDLHRRIMRAREVC